MDTGLHALTVASKGFTVQINTLQLNISQGLT